MLWNNQNWRHFWWNNFRWNWLIGSDGLFIYLFNTTFQVENRKATEATSPVPKQQLTLGTFEKFISAREKIWDIFANSFFDTNTNWKNTLMRAKK